MNDISIYVLFGILILLIFLSAFFSISETSMMALDRYRLRHLSNEKHRSAMLTSKLLSKPDKLLGLILFGSTLANLAAASVATIIGIRLYGETGIAAATVILTILILIFAEAAPKTIAAYHPARIAFPASYILTILGKILSPLISVINYITNGLLKLIGLKPENTGVVPLSREELRTVVLEAGTMIPVRHQRMLISILDLESMTVDEFMIHRSEIIGINVNDSSSQIIEQITNCQHTRLPVYRDSIDNIIGMLHVRRFPRVLLENEDFSAKDLIEITHEPYFVPLGTPLHIQLRNFQQLKKRFGLVVDEYGDIQGIVTLEDILEEIVGEFTTDMQNFNRDIHPQEDGTVVIDGSAMIRDINKQLKWYLPIDGPKTINGLILEQLETIPEPGMSLKIGNYTIEILKSTGDAVRTMKITYLPDKPPEREAV